MTDYKIAIAIDESKYNHLYKNDFNHLIDQRVTTNNVVTISTVDGDYKILKWEWETPQIDAEYENFVQEIKRERHAMVVISEENDIETDIVDEDSFGCDEMFDDILAVETNIRINGDILF